ncbi:MAG: metal ABC transporter permease [bacterium]|nr:metal ABC transporter permease [bacterium]MDA1024741.1 metal ABC transporter permease [bacterium]
MALIEIFSSTFMLRALISGLFVGALLAALGVFTTLRRMSFFGEGIAHASLAGIAIGLLSGFAPLPIAVIWGLLIALLIYLLEEKSVISSDSLIGIFFTSSMAFGVILIGFIPGYQPELLSFLFGNILTIQNSDVLLITILCTVGLAWLSVAQRQLAYLSFSEESAIVGGISKTAFLLPFYLLTSVAIVLGVKILGIILVSALMIIPAATSRNMTHSFRGYVIGSIVIAELSVFLGLIASYSLDLPSGATIVLTGSSLFLFSLFSKALTS